MPVPANARFRLWPPQGALTVDRLGQYGRSRHRLPVALQSAIVAVSGDEDARHLKRYQELVLDDEGGAAVWKRKSLSWSPFLAVPMDAAPQLDFCAGRFIHARARTDNVASD
jgi:hypothetical protein